MGRIYHFKCLLGNYTFIIESYDLLRKSLVLLSIWLIMLIIIAQKRVNYKKLLLINMIVLLVRLVFTFNTTNIIIFWGYQPERLKASLSLFFYTLFASLPLLISIVLSFICLVQRDIKVVIAYSSVVHMALVIIGALSL